MDAERGFEEADMDALKYPIGSFARDAEPTLEKRRAWIDQIAETPARVRAAVDGLSASRLDTPYRPGGWTVRQVVHHLPDSHLNAYTRLKLALTEDEPAIRPYDEGRWAELHDAKSAPPEWSLALLDALHLRWVDLWRSLEPASFDRRLAHPDLGLLTIDTLLQIYAWHGRHHTAHITALRERNGW